MKKILRQVKGFTLIELLIVIFIIGLLASAVIIIFERGKFDMRNNDNAREKDLNDLSAVIEEFRADHGHYPFVNWHAGKHAWQAIHPGLPMPSQCIGTINSYKPSVARLDPRNLNPGTQIMYDSSGQPCDDLSLQLLGQAYLPRMAISITNSEDDIGDINNWQTSGGNLKRYLDETPKDPQIKNVPDWLSHYVCKDHCPSFVIGGVTYQAKPAADYDSSTNPDDNKNIFRYFYNSYYECGPEGVVPGDRYWINAITQRKDDGDPGTEGLYFVESGNMNLIREPKSQCGQSS